MHGSVVMLQNPGGRVLAPEEYMTQQSEFLAMRRALSLAASTGRTLPNPRVGCVVLDTRGKIVGEGAHEGAGLAHAEIVALRQAGQRARGATAIVTLEPCNHTGRTGPCAQALIDAGIQRVVYAQADPSDRASGGAARLEQAGISVTAGVLEAQAAALNGPWHWSVANGRPFVTWKFAATLDGRSAASDGSSRWITGLAARRDVHTLRAQSDAIMAGTGTILIDNPRLSVRDSDDDPVTDQPLRVIVGNRDVPKTAAIFDEPGDVVHLRTHDVDEVLHELAQREIRHIWLEGGPRLAGAFLQADAINQVVAYMTPALLGDGLAALQTGPTTMSGLQRLTVDDTSWIDTDLRIIGRPRKDSECSPGL